ncbi:MAG: hypothetical protein ABIO85_02655 [Sphingomicrobium sp.]
MSLRDERRLFWTILAVAVLLRLFAFSPYAAKHEDELMQYIEQAHRLDFGYGIVPWEFRYGIRSWLIPLLLAGPMAVGERIDPGGTFYLILPRLLVTLFNLSPVIAAWVIGRRHSLQHAIVAMAVTATWVECVLYSVETLSESLATSAFMIAAAVMSGRPGRAATAGAGALLGLAFVFRFQFAPAMLAYVAIIAGRDWRRWAMLAVGGAVAIAGGGLIDLAMGQLPYQWLVANFRMNIGQGRMSGFGAASPFYYLYHLAVFWLLGMLFIPPLAAIGGRRHWALFAAAVVNLLFHHLFAHKEYRFIWLSVQILVVLAALGSVDLLRRGVAGHRRERPEGAASTALLVAAWAGYSLLLAMQPAYRLHWRNSGNGPRLASEAVRDPSVCGIAVPQPVWADFGYGLLHRNTPVYVLPLAGSESIAAPGALSEAFNAAVSWHGGPPGFAEETCRGGQPHRVCLYRRAGTCHIDGAARSHLMQNWLLRTDE